jgi:hypothetical protein
MADAESGSGVTDRDWLAHLPVGAKATRPSLRKDRPNARWNGPTAPRGGGGPVPPVQSRGPRRGAVRRTDPQVVSPCI